MSYIHILMPVKSEIYYKAKQKFSLLIINNILTLPNYLNITPQHQLEFISLHLIHLFVLLK